MNQNIEAEIHELLEKQRLFAEDLKSLNRTHAGLQNEMNTLAWEAKTNASYQEKVNTQEIPTVSPVIHLAKMNEIQPEILENKIIFPEKITSHKVPLPCPTSPQKAPVAFNTGEWEINFGRIWLVRIGVLLLLTGLVFLSTYAYKNWLFDTGAELKVGFFFTISLLLSGAGLWLEKWKDTFQHYGRVLASGGIAAGYYTIYAAHFVPTLKIIHSPILEGILLSAWAGVMLGYAVWKQSRVVAVMAIGLAFYGTIMNPSGWLSLFSALLLSGAGIWLMLRFRWISLGLGIVAAAYISHAFWLGFYPSEVNEFVRIAYLASYWLLFAIALIISKAQLLPDNIQRLMAALNNSSAWFLTVFSIPWLTPHAEIGWISIGVGIFWMILSALAGTGKLWHRSIAVIFGFQGLMIASLGVLIETTGYTRFLILGVEACILLLGARQFGGMLARGVSGLLFVAAMIYAIEPQGSQEMIPWLSYAAFAGICAIYTGIVKRDETLNDALALIPATVTWAALVFGVFCNIDHSLGSNGIWIAIIAVILTASFVKKSKWIEGIQELALISVLVAFVSGFWFMSELKFLSLGESIFPVIAAGILWYLSPRISDFWGEILKSVDDPDQQKHEIPEKFPALEWLNSLMFWMMLLVNAIHQVENETLWLILGGGLAISGHWLAEFTKRRSIGLPALAFHLCGIFYLIGIRFFDPNQANFTEWLPALLILAHLALVDFKWNILWRPALLSILPLLLTFAIGAYSFTEQGCPFLYFTLLGILLTAWAYYRKEAAMMLTGSVLPLLLACVSMIAYFARIESLHYVPILSVLVIHGFLWIKTQDDPQWKLSRDALLFIGLVALSYTTTSHVHQSFGNNGFAICWALLATLFFCIGLSIRSRPYRLIGLVVLSAAVLHVLCIDVIRLETLGRILSFITLGLVLLALGFLYNKFQDVIRKFL